MNQSLCKLVNNFCNSLNLCFFTLQAIIKLNLTSPLVAEIFPILCEACAEEVKDEAEDEENDEHTASTQAGQVRNMDRIW